MRKNRMLNETMLKLAEKGIVPAGRGDRSALGGGRMRDAAAATAPLLRAGEAGAPAAAWSDLRKGVLMGGVGLALTLYSLLDDGSPNWLGLVLLFVGIGYVVLWCFEDRHLLRRRASATRPRPGPAHAGNPPPA